MIGRAAIPVLVLAVSACSALGTAEVHIETGNQPTGFLTRPLGLTLASDESIQTVAQGICDNVKRGSTAMITFVGKMPSPDPLSFSDWGRYRYDCQGAPALAKAALPVAAPRKIDPPMAPAAVVAGPVSAPVSAPAAAPPSAALADAGAAPPAGAVRNGRECLMQQGRYHVCLGNCLLNATATGDGVGAACEQGCAPGLPAQCR